MKTTLLLILLALNCGAQTAQMPYDTNALPPALTFRINLDGWPSARTSCDNLLFGFGTTNQQTTNIVIPNNYSGTIEFSGQRLTPQDLKLAGAMHGFVWYGGEAGLTNFCIISNGIPYSAQYTCISNTEPVATIAVSENSNLARKMSSFELNSFLSKTTTTNSPDGTFKVEWIEGGFKESFSDVAGNSGFSSRIDAEIARTNYCADFVAEFYTGPKLR